jgi:hypothetical protein
MLPREMEREVVDEIERLLTQLKKARTVSEARRVGAELARRAAEYRQIHTQA